ncbi:MAG: iron-containing alcohol dehydrogenase [Bacilli bacterium]
MQDFIYENPTKIYFGRDSLLSLKDELNKYGNNVLLVYGMNSIKRIGLYDKVIKILKQTKKNVFELSGVSPNPTTEKLYEGVSLVREHQIDFILAVGGGSVIDLAKGVSASSYCFDMNPYTKYWVNHMPLDNDVVPLGAILTMTGTGSETNGGSVVSKDGYKIGRVFPTSVYPRFAIMNPVYTYTVSEYQMLSGIFDIFSHLMEQYFSGFDNNVSDSLLETLMRDLMKYTKIAIKSPHNYEARSNIMWISSLALNTITGVGKTQDWEVHNIEHQLSAYTDCAHGMGLAAISVPYYKKIYLDGVDKFYKFATNVFHIKKKRNELVKDVAYKGILALDKFIRDSKMVYSIKEFNVNEETIRKIANTSSLDTGGYKTLTHEDIYDILLESYNTK